MPLDTSRDVVAECRQPYPLPADARYVLDGILNDFGIDDGSYVALNLFVPRKPILDAIDGPMTEAPATWRRRFSLGLRLMRLVDEALPTFPDEVRNGIAFASKQWLRRNLVDLAEMYAGWAFEDETTGGAMEPWLPRWRQRICRNGEVGKRTARRLHAPSFIARAVKARIESRQRREMATAILHRIESATDLTDCLSTYAAEMAAQRERERLEGMRRLLANDRAVVPSPRVRLKRKRAIQGRAVIKRSLRAATAVLPESDVRAFIHGERICLSGATIDLAVRLQATLSEKGHGVLNVTAIARDGTALASLCVFHERTPALDQLAALALAMGAGEEADIIHDANIVQMFPAGREHPLLAAREKRDAAVLADTRSRNWTQIDRSYWSFEERRARETAYWDATKHIWIERLAVFVCGRRVKLLGLADGGNA